MNTLDKAEAAIYALRSSTRRQQARAVISILKTSDALSRPECAAAGSAQDTWNAALDLILEEKA
jgi:hypothetical protein